MLLAIDTATKMTGIALHDGEAVRAEHLWHSESFHTVELAPEVALLMRRASIEPSGLSGLAVAQGPGSYTGLRIGMAYAKGLALAKKLSLVAVPTLDILARGQPPQEIPMLAIMKAGRARYAIQWYQSNKVGWNAKNGVENLLWEDILTRLDEPAYVCGELDKDQRRSLRRKKGIILAPPAFCVRRPAVLAEIALQQIQKGELPEVAGLSPIYLGNVSGVIM
jgi:tRNA threonylcarbamoyladenosine biosynthesis protein TsaB